MFTKHNPHLITLRERKSRYLVAIKNNSRRPQKTVNTLVKYMKKNDWENTVRSSMHLFIFANRINPTKKVPLKMQIVYYDGFYLKNLVLNNIHKKILK
jgi:hypothetical protein